MRIIHTSDWHLGSSWNGIDRTDELFGQVDKVCEIVSAKHADVLLVAGDIFERVTRDKLHQNSKRLAEKLKNLVEAGCHVILVPGNHDFRDHFRLMKTFLELESGKAERVHIVEGYEKFEIDGVQFVVLPYPDREVLERVGKYRSSNVIAKGERNKSLSDVLADFVHNEAEKIDPTKPAVFVTHLQIIGVNYSASPKEASYNEDLSLASNCLPTNVAYIALGHIHQSQKIPHPVECWYSGSFDRMDLGERNDDKCVLLIDIDDEKNAKVEQIPIETSKFEELTVSAKELEDFAETYTLGERTYGRLVLKYVADDDILAATRFARNHFKNFQVIPQRADASIVETVKFENPRDYKETVFRHLEDEFGESEDFEELKRRANELIMLIMEVENASAKN